MYSYPDASKINIREICDSRCVVSASAVDNEGAADPIELAIVPVGEDEIVALEVTGGGTDTGFENFSHICLVKSMEYIEINWLVKAK